MGGGQLCLAWLSVCSTCWPCVILRLVLPLLGPADVEVFRRLYEEVGLGWVYATTKNPTFLGFANK